MKATERKVVAHGLGADFIKVRQCQAFIINDTSGALYDLNRVDEITGNVAGSIRLIDSTDITLQRTINEYFESTALFDTSTGFNRGTILLWYEI